MYNILTRFNDWMIFAAPLSKAANSSQVKSTDFCHFSVVDLNFKNLSVYDV